MKKVKVFLKWVVYYFMTTEERVNYKMGVSRGMNVTHSHDDSKILYGSVRKFYYENKPPRREYLTYNEFMEINLTK